MVKAEDFDLIDHLCLSIILKDDTYLTAMFLIQSISALALFENTSHTVIWIFRYEQNN